MNVTAKNKDGRKPYKLPESDRERLKKSEMTSLKMMITLLFLTDDAKRCLSDRLTWIPRGRWRASAAVGLLNSVCNDILGTIPLNQHNQINDTIHNFKVQVVPNATPLSSNVIFTRAQAEDLVKMAKDRCLACTEDGYSCKKCPLYQFLETTDPLEDYGSGLICPYSPIERRG